MGVSCIFLFLSSSVWLLLSVPSPETSWPGHYLAPELFSQQNHSLSCSSPENNAKCQGKSFGTHYIPHLYAIDSRLTAFNTSFRLLLCTLIGCLLLCAVVVCVCVCICKTWCVCVCVCKTKYCYMIFIFILLYISFFVVFYVFCAVDCCWFCLLFFFFVLFLLAKKKKTFSTVFQIQSEKQRLWKSTFSGSSVGLCCCCCMSLFISRCEQEAVCHDLHPATTQAASQTMFDSLS